jgi:DNA polymerase
MSVGGGEVQIGLPNGRLLTYRNLRRLHGDVYATFSTGEGYRETKLWGGSLTENIVQAASRDIFAEGLLRLIRAGLKVVMHCHDEFVLEVDSDVRREDVEALLRPPPEWAPDLPVEVESWEGESYARAEP